MAKRYMPNQKERTSGPDFIPVYHVHLSTMGNGPTFDDIGECCRHVEEVLADEESVTLTIRKERWPVKKYVDLPEFPGY